MGLVHTNENCIGCNRCIRVCPSVGANIAVEKDRGNVIEVDPARCIACGACIDACEHDAREYIDDVERYLVRALRNACIDYIRRRPPILMTSLEGAAQIAEDSEADKEIRDEYERINRLLQTIPAEQAEIVRLHCTDGLTFRQIAEVLDMPEATVKSRYRYAIDKIRKAYEDSN